MRLVSRVWREFSFNAGSDSSYQAIQQTDDVVRRVRAVCGGACLVRGVLRALERAAQPSVGNSSIGRLHRWVRGRARARFHPDGLRALPEALQGVVHVGVSRGELGHEHSRRPGVPVLPADLGGVLPVSGAARGRRSSDVVQHRRNKGEKRGRNRKTNGH